MTAIGVLGGGQLGRMLALAGYPLDMRFRFFDPAPDARGTDCRARSGTVQRLCSIGELCERC